MTATLTRQDSWQALYSMEGPEGKDDALRYMERIFPRLPYGQQHHLQTYLFGLLRNGAVSNNGSKPRLRRPDIIRGMVVVDLAVGFLNEYGDVLGEFYQALEVLPAHDERTTTVLGETLRQKSLQTVFTHISDIASEPDGESAFRLMRRKHGVIVPYKGMEKDYSKEERDRMMRNAGNGDRDTYSMEGFEEWDFPASRKDTDGES